MKIAESGQLAVGSRHPASTPSTANILFIISENADRLVHVPIFGGLSGSEDRDGGDYSIQFINIGRVGDKSFEE